MEHDATFNLRGEPRASLVGRTLGNYVLEGELGHGGMGAVYRARHSLLGRLAAVKVLLPQLAASPGAVQRFFNEARAATSIRHLGIVEIYDYDVTRDGVAFIAMELLAGESLACRIARGSIKLVDSLAMVRQMCGALGAAHERGIIHRDLKPDNIFVIPDGEVRGGERIKLLDFGIAKLTETAPGMESQTSTGALVGTPKYMAPEQCRGIKIDHRADLYALGCILYELVAGRAPFRGEGVGDVLAAHIHAMPNPLDHVAPGTPPLLVALVARLLAKDPTERPASTRQLITELDGVIATLDDRALGADAPAWNDTPTQDASPSALAPDARPATLTGAATSTPVPTPLRGRAWPRWALAGAGVLAASALAVELVWPAMPPRAVPAARQPAEPVPPRAIVAPAQAVPDAMTSVAPVIRVDPLRTRSPVHTASDRRVAHPAHTPSSPVPAAHHANSDEDETPNPLGAHAQ